YIDGTFTKLPGLFSSAFFLGNDVSPTRTYVLRSPEGETATVTVPWLAFNPNGFIDGADYRRQHCSSVAATNALRRLGRRSVAEGDYDRRVGLDPKDMYQPLPRVVDDEAMKTLALLRESKRFSSKQASAGPRRFDITRPVQSDPYNAFYMLDDGVTGVWVFASLSPVGTFSNIFPEWVVNVTTGLVALQDAGARRLVVDVSGNGGGYVCASKAFTQYLINNTDINLYNFRLTNPMRALLKTDFYGPSLSNIALANPTDSLVTTTTSQTRGGVLGEFSAMWSVPCNSRAVVNTAFPPLRRKFLPEEMAFVSDGGCGSACAILVRSLRDQHGIRAYVYGGPEPKPFTPTAFEGGTIARQTAFTGLNLQNLTTSETSLLPKPFSGIPVDIQMPLNQCFSTRGVGGRTSPMEW
ncbi:hypothetical protein HDU67_004538, partial [Dinochytrium kinnereticum]